MKMSRVEIAVMIGNVLGVFIWCLMLLVVALLGLARLVFQVALNLITDRHPAPPMAEPSVRLGRMTLPVPTSHGRRSPSNVA